MKLNRLGNSGLQVTALGLGTNAFGKRADQQTSIEIIHAALDQGINFIDTANIYAGSESERIIGLALAGRRQDAVLATKAGLPKHAGPGGSGSSRHHLMLELEGSLRRLKTDYVDLYQIHTPSIPILRWKRHSAPWMIWSPQARSAISALPTMPPGNL